MPAQGSRAALDRAEGPGKEHHHQKQKLRGLSKARDWRPSGPCPARGLAHQPLSYPKSFKNWGLGSFSKGPLSSSSKLPPRYPQLLPQQIPKVCPGVQPRTSALEWEPSLDGKVPAGRVPIFPLPESLFLAADGGELGGETVGYRSLHQSSKNSAPQRLMCPQQKPVFISGFKPDLFGFSKG